MNTHPLAIYMASEELLYLFPSALINNGFMLALVLYIVICDNAFVVGVRVSFEKPAKIRLVDNSNNNHAHFFITFENRPFQFLGGRFFI